jgi:hypothetical protein
MPEKFSPVSKSLDSAAEPNQPPAAAPYDLFSIFAVVAFAIVFAGFARTFFLRFLFTSRGCQSISTCTVCSFRAGLFSSFIQSRLIASHRIDLHRRLGMAGAGFAGLAVSTAIIVAMRAGKRVYETQSRPFSVEGPPLALDFGACVAFVILISLALYFRRRSDIHKRLMLLGSSSILLPALGRIPGLFTGGNLWELVGFTEIVPLTFIVYDTVRSRRLHPAFAWGRLGIVLSWPTFLLVGDTQFWLRFAGWLVRL